MKKGLIKTAARKFALADSDHDFFEASWDLFSRVADVTSKEGKERKEHHETVAVNQTFVDLKKAIAGSPTNKLGHRLVTRKPLKGRYVIFSDHHVTYNGHRHNGFADSGNLATYVEALALYFDGGFTLVENGDVEDLVLYDPANEGDEVFKRRKLLVSALNQRRRTKRLEQLDRILTSSSNQPWIAALKEFDADRRLIRIAGNHDYDLQRPKYFQRLKQTYPNLQKPADYLFLHDHGDVRYVVMHGHQFDKNTAPGLAGKYGETITECLGVWFQGPDRRWAETAPPDGPHDWGRGLRPFLNNLVTDEHDEKNGWAGIFQAIFQRNIAWNYFEKGPFDAIVDEVMTGTRFFKFRHLNEENLRSKLIQHFPSAKRRPTLILGHSHEPRMGARSLKTGKRFSHYLNTASAGLFENLLWGIEVVDGEATLVSWRRSSTGKLVRRPWSARDDGKRGWLDAGVATPL